MSEERKPKITDGYYNPPDDDPIRRFDKDDKLEMRAYGIDSIEICGSTCSVSFLHCGIEIGRLKLSDPITFTGDAVESAKNINIDDAAKDFFREVCKVI